LPTVRRGEFQYNFTKISGVELYERVRAQLPENSTLFIATDEKNKQEYFKPLMNHYDVVFLDNFVEAIGPETNSNFYGMVCPYYQRQFVCCHTDSSLKSLTLTICFAFAITGARLIN
jgi:hypothetical protein